MTKIHETKPYCMEGSESADTLIIYAIDTEDELYELWDIEDSPDRTKEYEELTGCYNDYGVMPGELFFRYSFHLEPPFFMIQKTVAYNV